jgi:tetratricopeptide (TPR) repeat protein
MMPGEANHMNSNRNKPSPILYIILALVVGLLAFSILIYLQIGGGSKTGWSQSQQQDLAGQLVDSKLYAQAVTEYQQLLDSGRLDKKKQANINYIMGDIYLNQLKDYENAAARFIRAKLLDPDSQLKDKINKGLVVCYEAMGRSLEAQKQLERSTDLNPVGTPRKGGVVVAKIGDREITMNELEEQIEMLPPSTQEQFKGKEGKLKFLQGYIGSELLYDMALRKGLDKDREIEQGVSQFKKQMMINKALSEEIPQDFEITESEIQLYRDAHQDEFKDKKPDEARSQIESELKKMKQQEAYGKLLDKLNQAQKVKIFDDQL